MNFFNRMLMALIPSIPSGSEALEENVRWVRAYALNPSNVFTSQIADAPALPLPQPNINDHIRAFAQVHYHL